LIPLLLLLIPPRTSQSQSDNAAIDVWTVSVIPCDYVIVKTSMKQGRSTIDLPERDNTLMIKRSKLKQTVVEKSPDPNTYAVVGRTQLSTSPNREMKPTTMHG
jgi:hypothetical protein